MTAAAIVLSFIASLMYSPCSPVVLRLRTGRQPLVANSSCDPEACVTMCADPAPPPQGECCPTCDNSSCLFKGCVRWDSLGVQWSADPCTICRCQNGRSSCSRLQCQEPSCFGFPAMVKAGRCCPECDFGILANNCGPVPDRKESISLYTQEGADHSCTTEVLLHKCDKSIVVQNGQTYACTPEIRSLSTNVANCFMKKLVYKDIVYCHLLPLLLMDYNPDPYSCQFYVP